MPLYLRAPRKGLTPNWQIRGTYLGVSVERSAGTPKKSIAMLALRAAERSIEDALKRGPDKPTEPKGITFVNAAVDYMKHGGEARYLDPLIGYFGETLLPLSQEAINKAALVLYPNVMAATRARCVYGPISAIQHHALDDEEKGTAAPAIRMPKGAKGKIKTDFMWPEDAFSIIREADKIDTEFGVYLRMLLYVGTRKGDTLDIPVEHVRIVERATWVRETKNGDPIMLQLCEAVLEPLAAHLAALPEGARRVFRFHDGGHFKHYLTRAKLAACGLPCPKRRPIGWKPPAHRLSWVGFHTFRHTWATWMRRYGGLDVQGLVGTGNWADARSAARYSHVVARDEWSRVEKLPKVG